MSPFCRWEIWGTPAEGEQWRAGQESSNLDAVCAPHSRMLSYFSLCCHISREMYLDKELLWSHLFAIYKAAVVPNAVRTKSKIINLSIQGHVQSVSIWRLQPSFRSKWSAHPRSCRCPKVIPQPRLGWPLLFLKSHSSTIVSSAPQPPPESSLMAQAEGITWSSFRLIWGSLPPPPLLILFN